MSSGIPLASDHEHESANTATTDKPNPEINMATFVDEDSLMLYPGLEFRSNGSAWQKFKDSIDQIHILKKIWSSLRYCCGMSIIFDLVE
jgi:hypothetical protein